MGFSLNHSASNSIQPDHIKRQFLQFNQERLHRLQIKLNTDQQTFIELLPLLFHVNRPKLPGFVADNSPVGISNYRPTEATLNLAKTYDSAFAYTHTATPDEAVYSIFIMGSIGTIAYTADSDLDFWLCHHPELSELELNQLQEKANLLEAWATSLKLEVHFFLVNADAFRQGKDTPLSQESSGSAQHFLLLDEFYRTSVLVVGRYPAWWLVPAEFEQDYTAYVEQLLQAGDISSQEIIEFGNLDTLPADEFFGATLWHLYKALAQPYKAILKILLMEAYADEYPHSQWLSLRFKQAIYDGVASMEELDPYVMMLHKIEDYLLRYNETDRLELARISFYFKSHQKLSRAAHNNVDWQHQAMTAVVAKWDWHAEKFASLDNHSHWRINRILDERKLLTSALNRSYKILTRFARDNAKTTLIDPQEINILGRKLLVAFSQKSGKVDIINPGTFSDLLEEQLAFVKSNIHGKQGWFLYQGASRQEQANNIPLKQTYSLLELIAWAYLNGVLDQRTRVSVSFPDQAITVEILWAIIYAIIRFFGQRALPKMPIEALSEREQITQSALFVNLEVDPLASLAQQGKYRITEFVDAFDYSGLQKNLILSLEQIVVTSWQEVRVQGYRGPHCFIECICDYFNRAPFTANPPAEIKVYCFTSFLVTAIITRIEHFFADITECFYGNPLYPNIRYVLQAGHCYYILYLQDHHLHYRSVTTYSELLALLNKATTNFFSTVIDRYALLTTQLPLIYAENREDIVQIFFHATGKKTDVYILDDNGALFYQTTKRQSSGFLISHYQRFFESILQRKKLLNDYIPGKAPHYDMQFLRLVNEEFNDKLVAKPVTVETKPTNHELELTVVGSQIGQQTQITIYCQAQEFSSFSLGKTLFRSVAAHILNVRKQRLNYPIYVTDIDADEAILGIRAGTSIQTIHYLNFKKKIEDKLNQALGELFTQHG